VLTARPIEMRAGALIDYRLRLRGVPLRWQSEITTWESPHRFVDEQRRGPYRQWIHTHTFEDQAGGTMVRDQVLYRLYGPDVLTRAVNAILVAPDTRRIFAFRHAALEDCLGLAGQTRSGPVTIRRL
jgi:ligand-binding SRPBCC domain-containing protein